MNLEENFLVVLVPLWSLKANLTKVGRKPLLPYERSNTFASIQSFILATIEFVKLHMMKLVADVYLIRKQLNIVEKDEESSTTGT